MIYGTVSQRWCSSLLPTEMGLGIQVVVLSEVALLPFCLTLPEQCGASLPPSALTEFWALRLCGGWSWASWAALQRSMAVVARSSFPLYGLS